MIFQNIQDHPTNRNKKVFFYKDSIHANYFENLLIEQKIEFEKQIDHEGDDTIYYGVRSSDFKQVQKLNYLTIGNFRKPFIADTMFRYLLISISLIVLILAIIGALVSD